MKLYAMFQNPNLVHFILILLYELTCIYLFIYFHLQLSKAREF